MKPYEYTLNNSSIGYPSQARHDSNYPDFDVLGALKIRNIDVLRGGLVASAMIPANLN